MIKNRPTNSSDAAIAVVDVRPEDNSSSGHSNGSAEVEPTPDLHPTIDHTFEMKAEKVAVPLLLTAAVVGGAILYAAA